MQENKKITKLGYWETEGRNPLVGAFVFLFIIGGIYFLIQTVAVNSYVLIDFLIKKGHILDNAPLNYFDEMKAIYSKYKIQLLTIVVISQYCILFAPTLFVFKKWHNRSYKEYFKFKNFDILAIILSVAGSITIIPAAEFLSRISFYFFPVLKNMSEISEPLFKSNNNFELFFLIAVIGITPAVCEETLFRGYFQSTLERKIKEPWVYILSGTVFALYHFQPLGLLALIAAGIYLGFVFCRFGSLYASITAHFTYNSAIILFMNFRQIDKYVLNKNNEISVPIIIISSIIFLIIAFVIYIYTKIQNKTIK
jgi:membrane protease YdiL (CAAX protease family)